MGGGATDPGSMRDLLLRGPRLPGPVLEAVVVSCVLHPLHHLHCLRAKSLLTSA